MPAFRIGRVAVTWFVAFLLVSCARDRRGAADRAATLDVVVDTVASADGVPIVYEWTGQGSRALVLVHGLGGDRHLWDGQIEALNDRYRVVALDLAGHGASGAGRSTWTMEAYGGDVAAVLDDLVLEDAILVGHSMGGAAVVEAAVLRPGRVGAIVGVETFHDVAEPVDPAQAADFLEGLRDDYPVAARAWVRDYLLPPGTDSALVERVGAKMAALNPAIAIASLEAYFRWLGPDAVEAIGRADVPLAVINSDGAPTDREALRPLVPWLAVHLMEGVGHYPMLEAPHRFDWLLDDTLEEMPDPDG